MAKTKSAGNWNTDMDKAPKDGSVILLLTCNGIPLTAFWTKYKVKKEQKIVLPNMKPELIDEEGWLSSAGPGLVMIDPMVAWAKIYLPQNIKFEDSPYGNNGKVIPFDHVKKQQKKEIEDES